MRFPRTQNATNEFHHANQGWAVGFIPRNRNAAHCISMPAQKLRGTMHDDISTVPQRLTEIRTRECVVDDQARAGRVRDLGAGIDITDFQKWVRNCLRDQNAGFGLGRFGAQAIKVAEIRGHGFDSQRSKNSLQQIRGRAVQILRSEHSRAGC